MGKKVKVAIIGVGNCANSFVQGVEYYKNAKDDESIPGLMHVNLGGYHVKDVEFVAAFDIDKNKVGKDLSEAIFEYPNNTIKFTDVPKMNVPVHRGMTHDGLGKYLKQIIEKAPGETAESGQTGSGTATEPAELEPASEDAAEVAMPSPPSTTETTAADEPEQPSVATTSESGGAEGGPGAGDGESQSSEAGSAGFFVPVMVIVIAVALGLGFVVWRKNRQLT